MLKCDFCGAETDKVKRIALDKDYDRLSLRHAVMYACEKCSDKKEKERRERAEREKKAG